MTDPFIRHVAVGGSIPPPDLDWRGILATTARQVEQPDLDFSGDGKGGLTRLVRVEFLKGRLNYEDAWGGGRGRAPFASCVVVFWRPK